MRRGSSGRGTALAGEALDRGCGHDIADRFLCGCGNSSCAADDHDARWPVVAQHRRCGLGQPAAARVQHRGPRRACSDRSGSADVGRTPPVRDHDGDLPARLAGAAERAARDRGGGRGAARSRYALDAVEVRGATDRPQRGVADRRGAADDDHLSRQVVVEQVPCGSRQPCRVGVEHRRAVRRRREHRGDADIGGTPAVRDDHDRIRTLTLFLGRTAAAARTAATNGAAGARVDRARVDRARVDRARVVVADGHSRDLRTAQRIAAAGQQRDGHRPVGLVGAVVGGRHRHRRRPARQAHRANARSADEKAARLRDPVADRDRPGRRRRRADREPRRRALGHRRRHTRHGQRRQRRIVVVLDGDGGR